MRERTACFRAGRCVLFIFSFGDYCFYKGVKRRKIVCFRGFIGLYGFTFSVKYDIII